MATNIRYSEGRQKRDAAIWCLKMEARPCWICQYAIDYGARYTHPHAFECDELTPVSKHGSPTDPNNLAAAHRICNNWRSNRSVTEVNATKAAVIAAYGGWSSPEDFVRKAKSLKRGKPVAPSVRPRLTTDW